jgi:hypothetical protein
VKQKLLSDARGLSSGTMATLIRDGQLAYGYQCRDCWIIDQIQGRFAYWIEHCYEPTSDAWQDAWHAYTRHVRHIWDDCWTSSYQGSTDYTIRGQRYELRHSGNRRHPWNGDYFETGIIKQIGCFWKHCSMSDSYPPPEVIAAFPGYCPLTATFDWVDDPEGYNGKSIDNWQYVYHPDFGSPRLREENKLGDICAYAFVDYDLVNYETDIAPRLKQRSVA